MERLHLHTVQQLHLELADARERSGPYTEESRISQTNSKDMSKFGQSNGNQLDVNANGATSANDGPLPNGNADNASNQVILLRIVVFLLPISIGCQCQCEPL